MNLKLVSRSLGTVAFLIATMMVFSLPWAFPSLGFRKHLELGYEPEFEGAGFLALLASVAVSCLVGAAFRYWGRGGRGTMYRKEAMAIVGLSWMLATVLGALPFYFAGTYRCPGVRVFKEHQSPLVFRFGTPDPRRQWTEVPQLNEAQYQVMNALMDAGAAGLDLATLQEKSDVSNAAGVVTQLIQADERWDRALYTPGEIETAPLDRRNHYRIRWVRMGVADVLFESQSGFSTTGATVFADLEDPILLPHCILFWRSSTHFLGGLGIIVLFVTVLGQGSAGKALMRAEMPGPTKEGATSRMQHTAWLFAAMYSVFNVVLAAILCLQGLSVFDAICHSFGTMATGGFSTYNKSLGHFDNAFIDYTVVVFMVLAGTNFTLLYLAMFRSPKSLMQDVEWRTYVGAILLITTLVVICGLWHGDFANFATALQYGLFQVVSIITTTGYGTNDFDQWNSFGRGVLFLLMFVGGCAGSTGGGMKVIRHILFLKIMRMEIELAYHPTVVRPLVLGGKPVDDRDLRKNILVYFCLVLVLFVFCWMFVVAVEPDNTWGDSMEHKLIDAASGIAATLNNIGPGLGTVGATQNYTYFSPIAKILFVWLMMLGRLELFSILVLFSIRFWKTR